MPSRMRNSIPKPAARLQKSPEREIFPRTPLTDIKGTEEFDPETQEVITRVPIDHGQPSPRTSVPPIPRSRPRNSYDTPTSPRIVKVRYVTPPTTPTSGSISSPYARDGGQQADLKPRMRTSAYTGFRRTAPTTSTSILGSRENRNNQSPAHPGGGWPPDREYSQDHGRRGYGKSSAPEHQFVNGAYAGGGQKNATWSKYATSAPRDRSPDRTYSREDEGNTKRSSGKSHNNRRR